MKKWLNNKSNQTIILLAAVHVLLIFNFILPVYEEMPYFRNKINGLRKEYTQYKNFSLHIKKHEETHNRIQKELDKLKEQIAGTHSPDLLQTVIGRLQKKNRLKVITQEIETSKSTDFVEKITVKQTLEGNYDNQIKYLKELLLLNRMLILSTCRFQNINPDKKDPIIKSTLEFNYFLFGHNEN